MKLDVANLKVMQNGSMFLIQILMPDGSRNYLHSGPFPDINDAVVIRDQLEKHVISKDNILIIQDQNYFRINLALKLGDKTHVFHSRKLNLTDVVFEREQLLL